MLINLSNHPFVSSEDGHIKWPEEQVRAATEVYGEIVDLPFPEIPPDADTDAVRAIAKTKASECLEKLRSGSGFADAVHIMGEMTTTFAIIAELQKRGVACIASTSRRRSRDLENGKKEITFDFVRFRAYPALKDLFNER